MNQKYNKNNVINIKQDKIIKLNYHLPGFIKSFFVCRVNDEDEHICVFKIISPVRSDPPLPTHVPNLQLEPRRLHALYVEPLDLIENIYILRVEVIFNMKKLLCALDVETLE